MRCMSLFPQINRVLPLIRHSNVPVPIEMHLSRASGCSHFENTPTTYHSFMMCGKFGWCFGKTFNTIKYALIDLEKNLKALLEGFITDSLLTSIATLLDSKCYGANNNKVSVKAASRIKDYCNNLLKVNDFKEHCLGKYFTEYKLDMPCQKKRRQLWHIKVNHPQPSTLHKFFHIIKMTFYTE